MPARAGRESESGGGTMKGDVPAADEKKNPDLSRGSPFSIPVSERTAAV